MNISSRHLFDSRVPSFQPLENFMFISISAVLNVFPLLDSHLNRLGHTPAPHMECNKPKKTEMVLEHVFSRILSGLKIPFFVRSSGKPKGVFQTNSPRVSDIRHIQMPILCTVCKKCLRQKCTTVDCVWTSFFKNLQKYESQIAYCGFYSVDSFCDLRHKCAHSDAK